MSYQVCARLCALITLTFAFSAVPLVAQRQTAKTWTVLRTPDGHPDLQGVWSFATITPLERLPELAGKEVLTNEEAAQFEQKALALRNHDRRDARGSDADVSRAYNQFWYDFGASLSTQRTSLIVDPSNGRLPAVTPQAEKRAAARLEVTRGAPAGPEDRNVAERCILGFNAGPPMIPSEYNNYVQLLQTKEYVVIHTEMIHDARIIPLDGRPHMKRNIRQWRGDSRGHWEGDTLVVDTINFTSQPRLSYDPGNAVGKADENLHLVERFTRVGPDTIVYEFTVDDPTSWTKPWTARIPMTSTPDSIFEYACHEGNYGMRGMLAGARIGDNSTIKK